MRLSGTLLLLSLALAACQAVPEPPPPPPGPPAEPEPQLECVVASRYRQEGVASWYGRSHHGRRTANGETFDMNQPSAAHRALPLGTRVKVTNLANNRMIELRINDRGPYSRGRIIDLSYRAALALGFVEAGTTRVLIETIETC